MITAANSTEDALNGFKHANYRLVITDLFMEGMGGIEGIGIFRKINKDIPILAISAGYKGMSPNNALLAAKKIGATACMPKPLNPEELANKVKQLMKLNDDTDEDNSSAKAHIIPVPQWSN